MSSLPRVLWIYPWLLNCLSSQTVSWLLLKSEVTFRSPAAHVTERQWANFNVNAFKNDLEESSLLTSPPTNCRNYFASYDETLRNLIDKHAPFKLTVLPSLAKAPWFNFICRQAKVKTRRLEKKYRASYSTTACQLWRIQSDVQRRVYQTAHTDYWSTAINSCPDSRTLSRKLDLY